DQAVLAAGREDLLLLAGGAAEGQRLHPVLVAAQDLRRAGLADVPGLDRAVIAAGEHGGAVAGHGESTDPAEMPDPAAKVAAGLDVPEADEVVLAGGGDGLAAGKVGEGKHVAAMLNRRVAGRGFLRLG